MIRALAGALGLLIALSAPAAAARLAPELEAAYAQINRVRAAHGLRPLTIEPRLVRAAERLARDMAENDFFGHVGSDGSNTGQRADEAGYRWRLIGENIGAGPAEGREIVEMWMKSPGHRHNLLMTDAVDAGLAHVTRRPDRGLVTYRHYWVLVLGAPLQSR